MSGSCSMAAHIALIEIGAKFELVDVRVKEGQPRPAEFLKINPRGNVPVLQDDEFILREGVAILLHILDGNKKNDLLPESGSERDKVLEWLCFANSSLHPSYSRVFAMHKILKNKASENELYAPFIEAIQKQWDDVESHLQKSEFLCEKLSIADILITVIANWSGAFSRPINFGEKTKKLFKKVIEIPSYKKALEAENVVYKIK